MVKSAKGKEVDMESLRRANGDTVALGNANMNAQGDLLGRGGKVIKTREELAREYHNVDEKAAVKSVAISKTSEEISKQQKEEREKIKEKQQEAKKKDSSKGSSSPVNTATKKSTDTLQTTKQASDEGENGLEEKSEKTEKDS